MIALRTAAAGGWCRRSDAFATARVAARQGCHRRYPAQLASCARQGACALRPLVKGRLQRSSVLVESSANSAAVPLEGKPGTGSFGYRDQGKEDLLGRLKGEQK